MDKEIIIHKVNGATHQGQGTDQCLQLFPCFKRNSLHDWNILGRDFLMLAEQLRIVNRCTAFTTYALSSALSQRQTNLEDPKSIYNRPVRLCCDKV